MSEQLRRAAVVSPLRTPVGTFGGALRDVPVEDLAGAVVRAAVAASGIDPGRVDDVVFAQSYANSEVPYRGRERSQPEARFGPVSERSTGSTSTAARSRWGIPSGPHRHADGHLPAARDALR